MTDPAIRALLNASWLLKLRWVAVGGQLLTIIIVGFGLRIPIFVGPLLVIVAATTVSNWLLYRWLARHGDWTANVEENHRLDLSLGMVSMMDLASLTALLYATGGATNPFFLFYFVNLGLSAILLPRKWVWGLNLLAILCFVFLLYDHYSLDVLDVGPDMYPVRASGRWTLLQLGMIVAFTTCSSVIVYFLTRLAWSLSQHEMELREAQRRKAESDKLEALGTLAAGAAHELATPLSTIAVVARDVEKALEAQSRERDSGSELVNDIHLIRSELDRCRKILHRMSADAGQTMGETIQAVGWDELQAETLAGLPDADRVDWRVDCADPNAAIRVPLLSLSQALRGLIRNGLDASAASDRVAVRIGCDRAQVWTIRIQDRGSGMTPEIASRVGQPFFTTKSPGKGMGLGVFLAENLVRRLGGKMKFESSLESGTLVLIELPTQPQGPNAPSQPMGAV
jgi:two-component system sensor histidine kinase RegB